jgi:hypothetical protein
VSRCSQPRAPLGGTDTESASDAWKSPSDARKTRRSPYVIGHARENRNTRNRHAAFRVCVSTNVYRGKLMVAGAGFEPATFGL